RAYYRAYDRLEKIVRRRDRVAKSEDPRDLTAPPPPEPEASAPLNTNGFVSQPDSSLRQIPSCHSRKENAGVKSDIGKTLTVPGTARGFPIFQKYGSPHRSEERRVGKE